MSKRIYHRNFKGNNAPNKRNEALTQALDIRKFEIDLYWKRATYFWGFLIVIFTGYFAVLFSEGDQYKRETLLLISALGTLFSLGWFHVNKGSKFWQNNWERHVDYLEDEFMGPLYKMVIIMNETKTLNPLKITKKMILNDGLYSVSKINQALSFYILTIWSGLLIGNSVTLVWAGNVKILKYDITYVHLYILFAIYTIIFFIFMCWGCRTTDLESAPDLLIKKRKLKE